MDGKYYNLWSTDNPRTDANDEVVIKSVYDPSPVGYSLPASNAFTGFTTTGQNVGDGNNLVTLEQVNAILPFDKGLYFYRKIDKKGGTIFIPASGLRYNSVGALKYISNVGFSWVANITTATSGWYFYFGFFSKHVAPLGGSYGRSFGFPVRSAEERETHKFNIKHEMDGQYYNLWSTDNDRTVPNDDVVIKSVYDPSPVGYSLPASNAFTGFTTTGGNVDNRPNPITPDKINAKLPFDKGYYFYTKLNKQGTITFFPTSGFRHYRYGFLLGLNTSGYCWMASLVDMSNSHSLVFSSSAVYPLHHDSRSCGLPVRSAEEKIIISSI